MAKRITRKMTRLMTKKEVEEVMKDYSELETKREALQKAFEEEMKQVKEKYKQKLDEVQEQMEEQVDQLQHYAESHYSQFKKHRSISSPYGAIGFRINPPKVQQMEGFDPEETLERLTEIKPEFVLVKKRLNKGEILKHRDEKQTLELLHRCGLDVVQDETFFIEAKSPAQSEKAEKSGKSGKIREDRQDSDAA
jgi:phage host-nuclease inhibitor protein Gam